MRLTVKKTAETVKAEPATTSDPASPVEAAPVDSSDQNPSVDVADPTGPQPQRAEKPTVQLRRSTFVATLAAVAVAGAALVTFDPTSAVTGGDRDDARSPMSADPAAVDGPESSVPAPQLIEQALVAAGSWYSNNRTFAGFTYPDVAVAIAPDVLLLAVAVDGTCAYSKIEGAQVYAIAVDSTGETCLPATMQQAQSVLDSYATATAAQTGVGLGHLVTAVETAGAMYASTNYVNASPSFAGLTSLGIDHTTVVWVAPDGTAADVRIEANGACRIVHLHTTVGAATSTSEC